MKILKNLQIKNINSGASCSANWWSSTNSLGQITSFNPAHNEVIAYVNRCSTEDYVYIVEQAKTSFLTWREVPAPKRGELIRQIAEIIREYKSDLGSLVSLEMGKSKQEGDGEVQEMIDMADFAVGQARMLYGLSMHSERPHHRMYEQWHPLGVVGVITAFNFPVAVWAWNAFIAAICGNTVVWRPSSKVPLCAIAIQHICNRVMQANGYEGIFSTFISDQLELARLMVADRSLSLISFTGSTRVGCEIGQTVAKRMGRCILECSGNNAILVDETADLKLALPAIIFSAIGTAGQRCTTTRRLIIHESIYQQVIDGLLAAYSKITIGDPLDEKNIMGPLIDQAAIDNFVAAIKKIKQLSGKILFGGNVINKPGFYVEPTIVAADNTWDIVQTETFAPILYVMPYQNLNEAIAIQNNVCQGLSSALFTDRLSAAEQFLAPTGNDCGIANINMGTSGAEIGGAFGGEKATGGGREAGSDAWKAYMRRQTVTINWGKELPLAQGIQFKI